MIFKLFLCALCVVLLSIILTFKLDSYIEENILFKNNKLRLFVSVILSVPILCFAFYLEVFLIDLMSKTFLEGIICL